MVYPVLISCDFSSISLQARHLALSDLARQAVLKSAEMAKLTLGALTKDEQGRPLSSNGVHWSLSHKPEFVCGVAGRNPIGIDLEPILERPAALFDRIAGENEWALFRQRNALAFAQVWTAKEAVLKSTGVGITGLRRSRIIAQEGDQILVVEFNNQRFEVSLQCYGKYMVAVTANSQEILWPRNPA